MNTDWIDKTIEEFAKWHQTTRPNTRLERHEAMKAFLFVNTPEYPHARLENVLRLDGRLMRVDFVDTKTAIEIDDGPNRKAIRKLIEMRKRGHFPIWILILAKGRGGKATRQAQKADMCTVRIFARNNGEVKWEWLIGGRFVRTVKSGGVLDSLVTY